MKNIKKRLLFNLPLEIYNELKKVAEKRHMSMSSYILQAVLWRLKKEED